MKIIIQIKLIFFKTINILGRWGVFIKRNVHNSLNLGGSVIAGAAVALCAFLPAATLHAQEVPEGSAATADGGGRTADEGNAIIVTGSRLGGGFTAPTPVTVVGGDRIEALAVTNVGDATARLPAFRAAATPSTSLSGNGSGANLGARYLDLRGLGPSRTLVLVDGKRFVPSSIFNAVDANLLPALLIDRVEIVTGGASAAYGSDAVAGVVNVILDSDLQGFRAQAQTGISQEGDAESYQLSLVAGTGFADGRGRFVIAGEWSKDEPAGKCYSRDWCAGEHFVFQNPGYATNGEPANFWASQVRHSNSNPTGIINSPGALTGIVFNPDGSVRDERFQYGKVNGGFMIGGEGEGANFRYGVPYLKIPVERYNLFSNLEYDVSDGLTASLTASYGQSTARNLGGVLYETNLTIRRDNAFLPDELGDLMDQEGLASFVYGRIGDFDVGLGDIAPTSALAKSHTYRIAAGLRGDLGGGWRWDAYYQYGRNNYRIDIADSQYRSRFLEALDAVDGPDGPICRSSISDPGNGCAPLNLFGHGNFSQAAKDYAYGTAWQEQKVQQHVAAVNVQGSPAELWAGSLEMAAGLEFRRDEVVADADPVGRAGGWRFGNGAAFGGVVETKEAYLESSLPLVRDASFARLLELNGAVRVTDYSTSGTVTTWKAGVVYEPVDWLRLRGTRSRDIRAPNAQELFNPTGESQSVVVDRRTNQSAFTRTRTGGNPDLQPEIAKTWTLGAVVTPGGSGILAPLRLSVDWYDINVEGAIASLGPQQTVDRCFEGVSSLCDQITYGSDGLISLIVSTQLNLDRLIARGLDVEFDYGLDVGENSRLNFNILGSYIKDLITIDSVGPIDRSGQTGVASGSISGVPKWSLTSTTSFASGPLTLTVENRFIPKGKFDTTLVGPEDAGYDTTLPTSISRNRVSERLYTNLGVQYEIGMDSRTEFEVYGFISNLFNQDPPLSPGSIATNPALFDTIGRAFHIGIRARR